MSAARLAILHITVKPSLPLPAMNENQRITLFVDVIIPLPVPGMFTYRVPHAMNDAVETGKRVVVQFGRKKIYAALVSKIHQEIPQGFTPKYILEVLDDKPVVLPQQLAFWDWIRQYYMCHTGEVMQAALPSGLRLASESKIVLGEYYLPDHHQLSEAEFLITEALSIQPKLSISEVIKIIGFQKVMPLIKTMIEKKFIALEEELKESYKARKETFVFLQSDYTEEHRMRELMDDLGKRAYKQLEMLLAFLAHSRKTDEGRQISRKMLLSKSGGSHAQLKALVDKGVFSTSEITVSRLPAFKADKKPSSIALTPHQREAYEHMKNGFSEKQVVLLHGITSSGKTELYIKLIQETLEQGKQVLYLLPEIALTTQIINRLKTYFGQQVGVYHSRYGSGERVEVWKKVLAFDGEKGANHQIVLGPRSALFLPFSKLGLIIVDEEHDHSFKQFDPAPRYHARDAAIVLAGMAGAKVLLGSATPALESWHNGKTGKYGLVKLTERYGGMQLPEVKLVNLREEKKRKTMQSHFSKALMEQLRHSLEQKSQAILFQNRRGFSLRLECDHCNWIPECRHCDVSLIYHKKQNMLRCHYCGYGMGVPAECPSCNSTALHMHGFGTEKVEEELGLLLPDARIARLDLDTTRSKTAFQVILESFGRGEIDFLAGTQMVTKGLDFENVNVVGILNADNMLSYPDFRAHERSFQLMAQVSGRAGRKHKRGKVMIQTHQPGHPLLQHVIRNDYEQMAREQLQLRNQYHYPPYYRLLLIRLKHRDAYLLSKAAAELALRLRERFPQDVLGPEYPMVSRIKNLYIKQIMIKLPRKIPPVHSKQQIKMMTDAFIRMPAYKSIFLQFDVDPQ